MKISYTINITIAFAFIIKKCPAQVFKLFINNTLTNLFVLQNIMNIKFIKKGENYLVTVKETHLELNKIKKFNNLLLIQVLCSKRK